MIIKQKKIFNMSYIKHAQLWKEEPESLIKKVEQLPENAVIVEVGTADGGTTRIIYESTKNKNTEIFSVDVNPSNIAKSLLKETTVKLICDDSVTFAKNWTNRTRKPINFLLIDGDHTFNGVYGDYSAWIAKTTDDVIICFHDYDPSERGGFAHLGVRIFIDTLIDAEAIIDCEHEYRFLFCRKNKSKNNIPELKSYIETIQNIGIEADKKINDHMSQNEYGINAIIERDQQLDSLQLCYMIEKILEIDPRIILKKSLAQDSVLRNMEGLQMLTHAHGSMNFPFDISKIRDITDRIELSSFIAHEQVKLHFLINILKTIVSWNP